MAISRRSVFAPLPFDKVDSVYSTVLTDEFTGTLANVDLDGLVTVTSDLVWQGDEGGGDGAPNVAIVPSVVNHPGIIKLSTGATTPADGDICGLFRPQTMLPGADGIYIACIARIIDISDTKFAFGFAASATEAVNSSAANTVQIVFDPEDAADVGDVIALLQLNVGGTDLEVAFTNAPITENEWFLLELAWDSAGCNGRVTTDDGTESLALLGAGTTVLKPGFLVEAVGAAEETVDVDKYTERYLRRTQSDVVGA